MRVLVTFLFTLVLGITLIFTFPKLAINPGKISAGHKKISTDCLKCHTLFRGATEEKCVDCHKSDQIGLLTTTGKPITKDLFTRKPLLATDTTKVLFHQSLTNSDCKSCHILHSVIGQDKEPVKFQHDFLAADMKNECASCHEKNRPNDDLHRNTKDNCNACHTNKAWKPATFDPKKLSAQTS
ncbi:MAG: hypothetical protein HGB11_05070, partial [Chlorobiales bacterium]|nr:hypothetical protein [Chlorobiales bacterium]